MKTILSKIVRIYDNPGIAIDFLIRANIGIQGSSIEGLELDQKLPQECRDEKLRFFEEVSDLENVINQRSFIPDDMIGARRTAFLLKHQQKPVEYVHTLDGKLPTSPLLSDS